MRRTPDFNEQERELGRPSHTLDDREPDDRAPASGRARPGRPFPTTESDDDEDEYVGVAHRRHRAPTREQDDEDVAEEDIMDVRDDDELASG